MKRSAYRDRDYAFGQIMLTLRNAIGLTQARLADLLGVSRRAVGDWEIGGSYPKVGHLKLFIELAVRHRAFQPPHETDEIRTLWQMTHQKVLLDESWLTMLLTSQRPATPTAPRLDWDDALVTPTFYGRTWEFSLLTQWIVEERCRVVSVLGLGGIGKSAPSYRTLFLRSKVAKSSEDNRWQSNSSAMLKVGKPKRA